jgi:pimeloyl-ACP methyl ester carboxylesterase
MLSVSSTVNGWSTSVRNWWRPVPPQIQLPVVISPPPRTSTATDQLKHAAVITLATTGAVTLIAALWCRFGPRSFPRGRQSRPQDSNAFSAGDRCPLPSVAHQFFDKNEYRFINLSHGRVRYILRTPDHETTRDASNSTSSAVGHTHANELPGSVSSSRPVVVMVHGFSIACEIWKQQCDYLNAHGFTTLCFDNYGRGWSDSPAETVAYDESLYVGQIAELLFALNIHTPIDLLGVSMGGAIVNAFTATYPEKVNRLCYICPAGLPINAPPSMQGVVKLPFGIGPRLFKRFIKNMQAKGADAMWEDKHGDAYKGWGLFAAQNVATHPGFVRALYRTVCEFPMSDQMKNYEINAQNKKLKILILWGEKGTCVGW